MEDLLFKIFGSLGFLLLLYFIFVRPKLIFKRTISRNFIETLIDKFEFLEVDDYRFVKLIETDKKLELLILKPSNQIFDTITLRIMIEDEEIKQIDDKKYNIIDGLISTDLNFLKNRPTDNELQSEFESIEKRYLKIKQKN